MESQYSVEELHDEFWKVSRSPYTLRDYKTKISRIAGDSLVFVLKARENPKWAQELLMKWAIDHRTQMRHRSIISNLVAVKALTDYCDLTINWKRVYNMVPRANLVFRDSIPTLDQIRQVYSIMNRRMKFVFSLFVSSGIRIGAVAYLHLGDLKEIETRYGTVGRLTVYHGEPEQYYTFVSDECLSDLKTYLVERRDLSSDSPLIAHEVYPDRPYDPKGISILTLKHLIAGSWRRAGIVTRDFKQVHSLRKYFKTHLEATEMKSLYIELLMGHSIKLDGHYLKPTPEHLAEEYAKYQSALYISKEALLNQALEEEKRENSSLILNVEAQFIVERDKRIEAEKKFSEMQKSLARLSRIDALERCLKKAISDSEKEQISNELDKLAE